MRTPLLMPGTGLPNVYLLGGYQFSGEGDDRVVSYSNLGELYLEIGRAIATKHAALTGRELRFLRKRLGMTQAEIGALGGKSEQAAAKWEKSQAPLAESRVIRLAWLQRFAPDEMNAAFSAMTNPENALDDAGCYVFEFRRGAWHANRSVAQWLDGDHAMPIVVSALTKLMQGEPVAFTHTGTSHQLNIDSPTSEPQKTT